MMRLLIVPLCYVVKSANEIIWTLSLQPISVQWGRSWCKEWGQTVTRSLVHICSVKPELRIKHVWSRVGTPTFRILVQTFCVVKAPWVLLSLPLPLCFFHMESEKQRFSGREKDAKTLVEPAMVDVTVDSDNLFELIPSAIMEFTIGGDIVSVCDATIRAHYENNTK